MPILMAHTGFPFPYHQQIECAEMDSKLGNRIMIAMLAIGFLLCAGYALSDRGSNDGKAAQSPSNSTASRP